MILDLSREKFMLWFSCTSEAKQYDWRKRKPGESRQELGVSGKELSSSVSIGAQAVTVRSRRTEERQGAQF